jgi:uncharacterized protein (TIGR02145 family)
LFSSVSSFSQISIFPVPPACEGDLIQLSAVVTGIYGTESYSFEQFPYSPELYEGGTPVVMGDDAVYPPGATSTGIDIGFPFCFLNNSVDHFWIGSNGWISFLPGQPDAYVAAALPNPGAPQQAIFAPWQDWDPSKGPQHTEGYIFYKTEGVAPDRKLIVYWKNCPLYQCNDSTGSFQIVLHETTNIIDNHISLKSTCMTWPPDGPNKATQGIQSSPDLVTGNLPFYIAFDRNQSSWHVWPGEEESTHFIPSGITWHEGSATGPIVGYGDKIFVTATVTTTYWAVLAACDNSGNYEASVNVIVYPLPIPAISGDVTACQNDIKTYTTMAGNNHYTYIITGGASVGGGGANDNWVDVQWTTPGSNSISLNYTSPDGCTAVSPYLLGVTVSAFESPVITATALEVCPETDITFTCQPGKTNYVWIYPVSGMTSFTGGGSTDNFLTIRWSTPGPKTVTVNYTDAGCTGDPPASIQVNIKPTPVLDGPLSKTICSVTNTSISLTSTPAGSSFSWIMPTPECSAEIAAPCPLGLPGGNLISDVVSLVNSTPGTVKYFITPTLDGCSGIVHEYLVNVSPLPDGNITGDATVCLNGNAPLITFTGSIGVPPFTFTYHVNSGPDQTISTTTGSSVSIPVPTAVSGLFTYHLTQVKEGSPLACQQLLTASASVLVNTLPTASVSGTVALCQNSSSPFVTFTGADGTPPYTFTYKINNGPDQTITTSVGNSVSVPVSTALSGTITCSLVNVQEGSSEACSQPQTGDAIVSVYPLPVPTISGPVVACKNTTTQYTTEPGMLNYLWTINPLLGTVTPVAGLPNTVDVTWNITGSALLSVNYSTLNNCTAANASTYQVTVQELPIPVINGLTKVCAGDVVTYTTDPATSYIWGIPVAGGTYTGGGPSDSQLTMTWLNPGTYTILVNYTIGNNGCTAVSPTPHTVTVHAKPTPSINAVIPGPVCGFSTQDYFTQGSGNIYQWTITGGTNQTPGNSSGISVLWGNTPPVSIGLTETIHYPDNTECFAQASPLLITLKPWPSAPAAISGSINVCRPASLQYSVPQIPDATTHQWVYTGTGAVISGNGSPVITIDFSATATSGVLTVTGNNDCGNGPVSTPLSITVNPRPEVNYDLCNDPVTTLAAKKFMLRGGTPYLLGNPGQEGYSTSNGTQGNNPIELVGGNYYFNPGLLSPAETGIYPVSYRYTNQFGCDATSSIQNITVVSPGSILTGCPGTLTDPRIAPPNTYHTLWIGSHCWMQENLHYGNTIPLTVRQTDNCTIERYCLPSDDVNCTNYGGLYQWDELIQYGLTQSPYQGICPPGWHIPTSLEWQDLIDSFQGNGIACGSLQNSGFSSLLKGIFYLDNQLSFTEPGTPTATMYWSSTLSGNKPVARGLNNFSPSVSMYESSRANAFPVRCIQD